MKQRRGVSLVEMLVSIMVLSVITGIASTTIILLMQAQARAARQLVEVSSETRFASDFRRDAHAAEQAVLDAQQDKAKIILSRPDGSSANYFLDSGNMVRTVEKEAKTTQHDVYQMRVRSLELTVNKSKTFVTLTVTSMPTDTPQSPLTTRKLTVEAAIGFRARHANAEVQ